MTAELPARDYRTTCPSCGSQNAEDFDGEALNCPDCGRYEYAVFDGRDAMVGFRKGIDPKVNPDFASLCASCPDTRRPYAL